MTSSEKPRPASFPIVAVGASAGGLEAFTLLLKALPANSGMAFVLIQHLEPTHASALPELLSRISPMPVQEAANGAGVKPNQVYVIPPNTSMSIRNGSLRLKQRDRGIGAHHPIDDFCFALAEDRKSAAIGVLLSGSGSDGALGLRSIRTEGGITFAQEPKSAEWAAMPESAIAAGAVDFVMTPRRIAAELARIGRRPFPPVKEQAVEGAGLDKICLLLRAATGVDFRLYKQATVSRRVARRMALHKTPSLQKYADLLKQNAGEAQALADDIFIHVTSFFRDPECFQALRKQVFARWRGKRLPSQPIRIWSAGCSTGEELYSLAMLLVETLGDDADGTKIQLFGTDISERAIEQARAGIYTEAAVAGVSAQRLKRFFVKDRHKYQIAKPLRDLCVFAKHDLAKDPPFSKLDLVSCRNVLIYMGPALQKRTLSVFQFALKPGGFLFLGKSEAIAGGSDLFAAKDRAHRIFLRKPGVSTGHRFDSGAPASTAPAGPAFDIATPKTAFDFQKEAERVLLQRYAPPSLIVDPDLHIVHFQGDTSPFLSPATGQPSFHLLKMVRPEFIVDLRTLISQARRQDETVRREGIPHSHNGREIAVSLEVTPLKQPGSAKRDFLVAFRELPVIGSLPRLKAGGAKTGGAKTGTASDPGQRTKDLEKELSSTREYLRSLIAEHETAQEEMKAASEEILSNNEELQSTNEELETAKEELQSSNEELVSLNDELQHRNADLGQLSGDLNNLLGGIDIPILLVDSALRIRRFTPLAEKLFNLIGTDIGRAFTQIASNLDVADWDSLFTQVTEKLQIVEREVRDRNGHWYLLRMRPYKTPENRIDGVLLALLDIDSLKKSLEEVRRTRDYAESIVETVRESLLLLDGDLRVRTANRTFYRTFRVTPGETEGRPIYELGGGQWDIQALRKLLEEILPRDAHLDSFAVDQEFPAIGFRRMLINARRIRQQGNESSLILLAIEDVTEQVRRSESTVRTLIDSAAQGILAVRPDGTIALANRMTEKMFGYELDELTGRKLEILIPAEGGTRDAMHYRDFFAGPASRPMGMGLELEGCRKDGTRFPAEIGLSHIESLQGKLAVAFITDISRRKQVADALRESAAIMQAISDGTRTMIVLRDVKGRVIQANPAALETYGDVSHPARAAISPADRRVLGTGHSEIVEETLKAATGTKTLLVSKSPRLDEHGKIAGLIDVAVDITERKMIEAASEQYRRELQTLSARLIAAQEDQSKHLARELHDVFSQKLAVLAMDISAVRQDLPDAPARAAKELEKLGRGVKSMADDIHQISRQLHPSILDELGLAAALREECLTFSERHGVAVEFKATGVPKALPEDVALCLYRVAQGSLRNIAEHSGAHKVRFHLAGTRKEIALSVEDTGDGFDLAQARKKKGLGLISLEERVRMVNGVFDIQSQPGHGTRVDVRVPLRR